MRNTKSKAPPLLSQYAWRNPAGFPSVHVSQGEYDCQHKQLPQLLERVNALWFFQDFRIAVFNRGRFGANKDPIASNEDKSKLYSNGESRHVFESPKVGVGIVQDDFGSIHIQIETSATSKPFLGVGLEKGFIAKPD